MHILLCGASHLHQIDIDASRSLLEATYSVAKSSCTKQIDMPAGFSATRTTVSAASTTRTVLPELVEVSSRLLSLAVRRTTYIESNWPLEAFYGNAYYLTASVNCLAVISNITCLSYLSASIVVIP